MALDKFGRNINYLRISLTDKCNLRCVYCMPEEMTFRPSAQLMQDDELFRLVDLFASRLGFRKIRLTGGEPTIRPNLAEIVRYMANTPGIETVAMTTNAILLQTLARPLAEAGLQRVNISIDTLDPYKFKKITRWGSMDEVNAGIQASIEAGLGIKFNCVVVRNFNDTEDVVELAKLTLQYPYQVRYIEMMPFGDVADFQQAGVVSEEELRGTISAALGNLSLVDDGVLDGEARLYKLDGAPGTLGFISSVTAPFCASCNRARLTADGRLRLCLLRDKEVDLLTPLRAGATDDDLEQIIADGIYHKPWGHGLDDNIIPLTRVMSEIGG